MTADTDGATRRRGLDELARDAASGDLAAFERLVRRVHSRIHRWALVRVGDPDDAEDVAQAVLVRLHASLDGWEGRARFTTWLYRVTANEAMSWRRRLKRRARWVVRDPKAFRAAADRAVGPAEDRERARMVELVSAYFRDLPPRQREVFDLVDLQGYAPAEVAEMLEMNPNTVRANLFKARKSIRRRMVADARVETPVETPVETS